MAYLSEDKKKKAEEVAIEGLKTKLGTDTLAPMSQCPRTLHYTGKILSLSLPEADAKLQNPSAPLTPASQVFGGPHTPSMVRILEKGE